MINWLMVVGVHMPMRAKLKKFCSTVPNVVITKPITVTANFKMQIPYIKNYMQYMDKSALTPYKQHLTCNY